MNGATTFMATATSMGHEKYEKYEKYGTSLKKAEETSYNILQAMAAQPVFGKSVPDHQRGAQGVDPG